MADEPRRTGRLRPAGDRVRDEIRAWFGDDAAEARRNADIERRQVRERGRPVRPAPVTADDRAAGYPRWTAGLMSEDLPHAYAAAPGPYAGRGPRGYRRSDERIRDEVCDRLTDDALVDATDIAVRVRHGLVTLEGTVRDRAQKHRAEDLAAGVTGVADVENRIRVPRPAAGGEPDRSGESGDPALPPGAATRVDI
jgi:hypothetical protein